MGKLRLREIKRNPYSPVFALKAIPCPSSASPGRQTSLQFAHQLASCIDQAVGGSDRGLAGGKEEAGEEAGVSFPLSASGNISSSSAFPVCLSHRAGPLGSGF